MAGESDEFSFNDSLILTLQKPTDTITKKLLCDALQLTASTKINLRFHFQDRSMDSLTLPANYQTPTKPRGLNGNNTANLKSFRSVVLGKDGVGKSGI